MMISILITLNHPVTDPISITPVTKYSWVREMKGHPFSKRRQYMDKAKTHWQNFKIIFSRTTGPILIIPSTRHR